MCLPIPHFHERSQGLLLKPYSRFSSYRHEILISIGDRGGGVAARREGGMNLIRNTSWKIIVRVHRLILLVESHGLHGPPRVSLMVDQVREDAASVLDGLQDVLSWGSRVRLSRAPLSIHQVDISISQNCRRFSREASDVIFQ